MSVYAPGLFFTIVPNARGMGLTVAIIKRPVRDKTGPKVVFFKSRCLSAVGTHETSFYPQLENNVSPSSIARSQVSTKPFHRKEILWANLQNLPSTFVVKSVLYTNSVSTCRTYSGKNNTMLTMRIRSISPKYLLYCGTSSKTDLVSAPCDVSVIPRNQPVNTKRLAEHVKMMIFNTCSIFLPYGARSSLSCT